jgi:hypothetical protein
MNSEYSEITNDPPTEQWRDIPGFRGYQVSNLGKLRSCWSRNGSRILTATWRPLKTSPGKKGHRRTRLFNGISQKDCWIHRLVLEAFVGPCPPGKRACHRNDVPDDNRLENLYWGTQKENMADKKRNGHSPDQSGAKGSAAKLTDEQVLAIRARHRRGERQVDLAREFGVAQQTISKIVTNRTWQNLPIPPTNIVPDVSSPIASGPATTEKNDA